MLKWLASFKNDLVLILVLILLGAIVYGGAVRSFL